MAEPFKRLEAKFTGKNGGDFHQKQARDAGFEVGKWYVVTLLEVGNCSGYLEVSGKPGRWNTILFDLEVKEYENLYAGTVWEETKDRPQIDANTALRVDWARAIVRHYGTSRGAGSTFLQRHGWLSRRVGPGEKIVLLPNAASQYDVTAVEAAESGCTVLHVGDAESLVGRRGALVVEHSALVDILSHLLAALERDDAVRELIDALEKQDEAERATLCRRISAIGRVRARFGLMPGKAKAEP